MIEEHVLVVGQPEGEATSIPHPIELTLSLIGCGFQHRLRNEVVFEAEERLADALDHAVIIRLSRLDDFGVHFAITGRNAVVGGALEHSELLGLLRNFGNGLHCRGAGADHAHALVGEVDARVREAGWCGTTCP